MTFSVYIVVTFYLLRPLLFATTKNRLSNHFFSLNLVYGDSHAASERVY